MEDSSVFLTAGMFKNAGSTGGNWALLELCCDCENNELNGDWKNVNGVTFGALVGANVGGAGVVVGGCCAGDDTLWNILLNFCLCSWIPRK